MRNEGRRAAGRLTCNPYFLKHMGSDLHSDVALPVTFVSQRSRSFTPTGSCNCARSPARRIARRVKRKLERWKKERKENVRNEEACAA
jgi:hypothetical protein